jgi:uncharacterized RDD family membrane protein YckC
VTNAPAGWFPDPNDSQALRYWDGAAWTEHLAPRTAPSAATYVGQAGPTTPDGVPIASWGMRLLAYFIDSILVGVTGFVVTLPQQIEVQRRMAELSADLQTSAEPDLAAFWSDYFDVLRDQMVWQVPVVLLSVAYFVAMLRWKGATLGKMAVGLRVRLRDEPGQLPWRAIAIRVGILNVLGVVPIMFLVAGWWIVALVLWPVITVFLFVNGLRPLWDSKRQAFHDKAAGTNVVKVR